MSALEIFTLLRRYGLRISDLDSVGGIAELDPRSLQAQRVRRVERVWAAMARSGWRLPIWKISSPSRATEPELKNR
jgi:hypothetical protein